MSYTKLIKNCPYCGKKLSSGICTKCSIQFAAKSDTEEIFQPDMLTEEIQLPQIMQEKSTWTSVVYYGLAGAFILLGSFFNDPNLFWFGASGFGLKTVGEIASKLLRRK